jgi:hypothetical protein
VRSSQVREPLPALIHLERWCNDGSPSGLSFGANQVSPSYRPREGRTSFEASAFLVPWEAAEFHSAGPSPELTATVTSAAGAVLTLHPDNPVIPPGRPTAPRRVVPTSSGRTVIVLDPAPVHYAKLHYPGLLGRVPRELNAPRVAASIRMSAALDDAAECGMLTDSCAYLAESIGVLASVDGAEHGVIYREFTPRHQGGPDPCAPAMPLIPFFALFSADSRAPDDPPLLITLLRLSGLSAAAALRSLLELVLESYGALAFAAGLVPEDHAQNLLLQLSPDLVPLRVVRRDLLDWYADLEIRRDRGLPADFSRVLDTAADPERAFGGRSYAFDFRLGEYVLKPLVDCAVRYCGVDGGETERWIGERVHAIAARHGVDLHEYFHPYDQTSRFGPGLEIWRAGRPLLIDGPRPVYR